jgi:sugar (pentulose or hexulose) kinase
MLQVGKPKAVFTVAGRDRYLCGAATNAGASVLWWLDGLLGDGSKAVWDRALASTVPGADGLVLMPFPLGERPPYPAGLSARFLGETAGVRPEGLRRAAAESMAYRLRDLLDSVQGAFPRSRELVFSGVVAGSPGFMQMIADVLERPLRIYDGSNASLSGAAALSFQSQGLLGRWKGYAPSYKKAVVRPRVRPRAAYRLGYRRYRAFLEQEIRRRMESPRGKEI